MDDAFDIQIKFQILSELRNSYSPYSWRSCYCRLWWRYNGVVVRLLWYFAEYKQFLTTNRVLIIVYSHRDSYLASREGETSHILSKLQITKLTWLIAHAFDNVSFPIQKLNFYYSIVTITERVIESYHFTWWCYISSSPQSTEAVKPWSQKPLQTIHIHLNNNRNIIERNRKLYILDQSRGSVSEQWKCYPECIV